MKKSHSKFRQFLENMEPELKNSQLFHGRIILEVYSDQLGNLHNLDAKQALRSLDALWQAYDEGPGRWDPKERAAVVTLVNRFRTLLLHVHGSDDDKAY